MISLLKNFINRFLFIFGYRISSINKTNDLVKLYKYKDYNEYKKTQIYWNKQKINHVWADKDSLLVISDFINKNLIKENIYGLCHGSRNGFEQEFFNNNVKNSITIGSDISDTANNYKNSVVWDFHEINDAWVNYFDFIYTNSLDQSYDPKKALTTWLGQIKINGYIFLEHTDQHSVRSSGKMDPFGVEANFFPYLLSDWFGHRISIMIIKSVKKNKSHAPVWFFVIKKIF